MAVTDDAVIKMRDLIVAGRLRPGDRLPQENQLAEQLGISRNSTREAVRALVQARVLDVRHGSGTYVTSLEPALLLEGISFAVDLLRDDTLLEVIEVRELLEPPATRLAAMRMTPERLARIRDAFDRYVPTQPMEELVQCDIAFHTEVVAAAGNATLSSILDGMSSRTLRQRLWGGIRSEDAAERTVEAHRQILEALAAGDPVLAEAAALLHLADARRWLDAHAAPA